MPGPEFERVGCDRAYASSKPGIVPLLEPKAFITHVVALVLHGLLRNPVPGAVIPPPPPLTAQPWRTPSDVDVDGNGGTQS